ncbi:protein of unknown function [Streptomyces sp. KY75]|nr:protein of unknown function [Streptomyces sp. KY70]CAD5987053.1 protein of unknown function [Streptomyces sp. KY75]
MRTMRLSEVVVTYAYTRPSAANVEGTASPSRPPSPAGETPGTEPSRVCFPFSPSIRWIVPSSREATSRSPPGSAVSPQGDFSPSVSVETTFAEPLAGGRSAGALGDAEEPGLREAVGEAAPVPDVPSSPPVEHAADRTSEAVASAATTPLRTTGD